MTTSNVRAGIVFASVALMLAMYGCGGGYSPTDNGGGGGGGGGGDNPVVTDQVTINSGSFNPDAIQVSPGTVVTWTWGSALQHNVTFDSNLITDSPDQSSGSYQTAMPTQAGTYTYRCTIHGFTGSVLVQ